jgi:hypothetical protein
MKLVAEKQDALDIKANPRSKDRVTWHRIQDLVDTEACHRDWNIALYRLHRIGRIDNDQREAGDKYAALIRDKRKLWHDPMGQIEMYRGPSHPSAPGGFITSDRENMEPDKRSRATRDVEYVMGHVVADSLVEESEFELKRAGRINKRYKEAKAVAGQANSVLEDLLIDEIWPTSERCHVEISHALTRLSHFFNTGTNRKHAK